MADHAVHLVAALAALVGGAGCKSVTMTAPVTVNPMLIGPVRTIGGAPEPGWQDALGEPDLKSQIQSYAMASSSTTQQGNVRTTTTTASQAKSAALQVDYAVLEATSGDGRKTLGVQSLDCSNWGFFALTAIWSSATCWIEAKATAGGPTDRPPAPPFGGAVPVKVRVVEAVSVPAAVVQAAGPGLTEDTVFLKNGGRLRGHVMADEPSGVSLRMVDGSTRVIPRPRVDHIDYGK